MNQFAKLYDFRRELYSRLKYCEVQSIEAAFIECCIESTVQIMRARIARNHGKRISAIEALAKAKLYRECSKAFNRPF